jgi:hypothetical protein
MAEPILEQIALWHLAAIAGVTVANGYQQTLLASRSEEEFIEGDTLRDLSVLCALSAADDAVRKESETLDNTGSKIIWWQRFDAFVHLLGAGTTALAVDNRITRAIADIQKRLGVERAALRTNLGKCCGGLAQWIDLLPWEIGVSPTGACTIVNVPVVIRFEVDANNPYSS